jgi:hypothetical protein
MDKGIKERLGRYCTFTEFIICGENNLLVEISCVINKLEEQKLKEIIISIVLALYLYAKLLNRSIILRTLIFRFR